MNELALFAGAGGGILGGHLLGWRTVCAVERDAYAAQVLAARQNDRTLRPFPIWSDVCSFDGRPWRGIVDVVSGGFPCQDISAAGNGAGIDGKRSGLWGEMARIVCEVQPCYVFVENSPMLTSRGLGRVLGDLAALGFDAEWGIISAADTGAPHLRERLWVVANARSGRCGPQGEGQMEQPRRAEAKCPGKAVGPDVDSSRQLQQERGKPDERRWPYHNASAIRGNRWPLEPGVGRMVHGLANRELRIAALGNGQVPRVAAAAFHLLSSRI
ncbi:DNA cytosine methyltransferase [Achromobacter deleyi]|uniref:DNA cytosine methyltransferase n=1 Tax=Achromobacter deleyi TaxID=1353891 RepID=UPI001582D9BB